MFRVNLFYQTFTEFSKCGHFCAKYVSLNYESVRNSSSFYTRIKSDALWKGALGVSKTSARRGRKGGGGKIMKHDLNRGQTMGSGRQRMVWPGLNAPIVAGKQTLAIQSMGTDQNFDQNLVNVRTRMRKMSLRKVHPLERGWSGNKMGGRWIGPPDPVNGEEFIGFDTQVLVQRPIFRMTRLFGKYKRFECLTVTGNMNGLAGFAVARHVDNRQVARMSKNKAAQQLQYFNLWEGNSLYHSFYSKYYGTELFVRKMPKGYGVRAHRCITAICGVMGLTDLHCKVEGSDKNYFAITEAFFKGLNNQKTYQQMADEKRLNVVELVGEYDYPVLLATPKEGCRSEQEISPDEILDFNMYIYNGRVIQPPKEKPLFYTKLRGWEFYTKKWQTRQSQQQCRIQLIAKYGSLESYLTLKDRERLSHKREKWIQQMSTEATDESKNDIPIKDEDILMAETTLDNADGDSSKNTVNVVGVPRGTVDGGSSRDRTLVVTPEESIEYMKSDAYKQTYGHHKIWHLHRRNFKRQFSPMRSRKRCIVEGMLYTLSPCPACRDEYLVFHYTNVDLLQQFIDPHTGYVYENSYLGLCSEQYEKLLVAVHMAKDYGTITFEVPHREYDYKDYYKNYKDFKEFDYKDYCNDENDLKPLTYNEFYKK